MLCWMSTDEAQIFGNMFKACKRRQLMLEVTSAENSLNLCCLYPILANVSLKSELNLSSCLAYHFSA